MGEGGTRAAGGAAEGGNRGEKQGRRRPRNAPLATRAPWSAGPAPIRHANWARYLSQRACALAGPPSSSPRSSRCAIIHRHPPTYSYVLWPPSHHPFACNAAQRNAGQPLDPHPDRQTASVRRRRRLLPRASRIRVAPAVPVVLRALRPRPRGSARGTRSVRRRTPPYPPTPTGYAELCTDIHNKQVSGTRYAAGAQATGRGGGREGGRREAAAACFAGEQGAATPRHATPRGRSRVTLGLGSVRWWHRHPRRPTYSNAPPPPRPPSPVPPRLPSAAQRSKSDSHAHADLSILDRTRTRTRTAAQGYLIRIAHPSPRPARARDKIKHTLSLSTIAAYIHKEARPVFLT
ncbi:hypothetical protein HYPSUDRAFT_852245 [Hypholoma sublateritium FD-334 SS-4]|uniref:Uncharacterized protein n=1 Tax=Hypholoma sublateritium (strain FD-334 SS-4) TaxID=945553 RepID=A0A0D2M939_HYPSF|nr:hypothetical protein HYPSUDRAFT_852245 [Hypholoma sublateritium FD-334 SS-4]